MKKNCLNLKCFLTHETYLDIDGLDLFSKLKVLEEVLKTNDNSPINVLNYIKKLESFPNACIAFKILLTIHVTISSAETSFSKLKLIKSYLISTMSQERLSVSLDTNEKWKLFYYSAYFCYYSWDPLHFLVLFMGLTVLFQLNFTFIYSIFSNKFLFSVK